MIADLLAQVMLMAWLGHPAPQLASAPIEDAAAEVATLMEPRATATAAVLQTFPEGTSRELARLEFGDHPGLWTTMERELADDLREVFSPTELIEIRRFLESPSGRAWITAWPTLMAHARERSRGADGSDLQTASLGCVVALLAPNLEAAMRKAGHTESTISVELFEAMRPIRAAAKKTCDCVFEKMLERWPSVSASQLLLQPGYKEYASQLVTSGACPVPRP